MSFTVQHKRSGEPDRRPDPADLELGQVAINYNSTSPGMFFKNTAGGLVKVGPCAVGQSPPTPNNYTTLTTGEMWLDTTSGLNKLKVWSGSVWLEVS